MYISKIRPINVMKLASVIHSFLCEMLMKQLWKKEEGSVLNQEPEVNSFSFPNVSFTFPKEDGGKSLRTVPDGPRVNGEVYMGTPEVNH